MHIGLSRPKAPAPPLADVDAAAIGRIAEEAGFESVLLGEHPITPTDEVSDNPVHTEGVPFFQETIVGLSRLSAATTRLRFGFGVCLVPEHQPVRLAKQLARLDHYSGGRLLLGIGTGWSRAEYAALGARFDRRWEQTREAVGLMRRLWTEERVAHDGTFFTVPPVCCFPQPTQPGGPPVLIGAVGDKALERVADYGDGWMPAFMMPDAIATGPEVVRAGHRHLAELAEQAGRPLAPPRTTAIIREARREHVDRYREAGVERLCFTLPYIESEGEARRAIEDFARKLL